MNNAKNTHLSPADDHHPQDIPAAAAGAAAAAMHLLRIKTHRQTRRCCKAHALLPHTGK
jgi:hypothetical protein